MTLQQQIRGNRLRSSIVVLGFVLLLVVLAGLVGLALDVSLGVVALIVALVYAVFGIIRSRSLISGITHAQPLGPDELRPLRRLVENVSIGAGLPVTPELRVVDDDAPNAFAAGLRPHVELHRRHHGAASHDAEARAGGRHRARGLAHPKPRHVPDDDGDGLRGRDRTHRRHRVPVACVRRALAKGGVIVVILAVVGFVLAPYAALLLRMSLSRRREYLADASAAEILNDPEAMALALNRLELDPTSVRYADASTAHLWVESPTDRIDSERRGIVAMSGLFNTHPPLRTRIAALEEAGGFRLPERIPANEPFAVELGLA